MTLEKKYPPETIETERLLLKRRTEECAEKFFSMIELDRANLSQFLYWVDDTNCVDDTLSGCRKFCEKWKQYCCFAYQVIHKDTEELIGSVDLQKIDWDNYNCEIGYFMVFSYQGKGYMAEAVNGLVKVGFDELGLKRQVITCRPDNKRSQAVARRCGFTHEGTLRKATFARGQFYDSMVFARLCCDD